VDNRHQGGHILRTSSLAGGSAGDDRGNGVDVTKQWSNVADGARRRFVATQWGQRRSILEMALGVALVVGGAVGVVAWQRHITTPQTVVIAARDLRRGDTLAITDLTTATLVGARGVQLSTPTEVIDLVGGTVRVDMAAGTLATPAMVERRTPPGQGEALVSVALRPGETPTDLAPGDLVRMVTVRLDPLSALAPVVTYDLAEVWAVRAPTDLDPTTIVTLRASDIVLERLTLADRVRVGTVAS
jgi:hypothetical protein